MNNHRVIVVLKFDQMAVDESDAITRVISNLRTMHEGDIVHMHRQGCWKNDIPSRLVREPMIIESKTCEPRAFPPALEYNTHK